MEIRIDTERAERRLLSAFKELSDKNIDTAIRRGINRALAATQTQAIRGVTEKYNLNAGDVRKGFKTEYGSGSATSMIYGYLKSSSRQFPVSYFKPKMISGGTTTRITSKRQKTEAKKAKFLRADKTKVTQGVVLQVLRGKDKVMPSAFFSSTGASVRARGKYNKGFQFDKSAGTRGLLSVSVASVMRSQNIRPGLQAFAERKFLQQLHSELLKRVKGIA